MDDDNQRKGHPTKRPMDLAIEYVDYNQEKHFSVGPLELTDVLHVLQGVVATMEDHIKMLDSNGRQFLCNVVTRLVTNCYGMCKYAIEKIFGSLMLSGSSDALWRSLRHSRAL